LLAPLLAKDLMQTFLSNLGLARKFALIGIVALATALLPTALAVRSVLGTLNAARAETTGIAPSHDVLKLIQLSQQHRGQAALVLAGREDLRPALQARRAEIDQALARVRASVAGVHDGAPLPGRVDELRRRWQGVADAVHARTIAAPQSFAQHSAVIAEQFALLDAIVDRSTLALDPEAGTYYTINAVFSHVPRLTESLGQMRAHGAALLARGQADAAERMRFASISDMASLHLDHAGAAFEKAMAADPSMRRALEAPVAEAATAAGEMLKAADRRIVQAEALDRADADYFQAMTRTIDAQFALIATAFGSLEAALAERVAQERRALWTVAGGMALLGALCGWLIVLTARTTAAGMNEAVKVAQRVAAGDLTSRIEIRSRDESGQLLTALKAMNQNLTELVRDVRQGSESIATGSAQIAIGNADLSQRTEEQASNLQQTAASMDQLTSTVQQNSATARSASELAGRASEAAARGGAVVGQVVDTMLGITTASRRIGDIIGVIDGIAFQTNILALNAAVEAARAGEQGRGFAVVAAEVRNLAQRSATAAREIKTLIGESVTQVEAGSKLVHDAGRSMDDIVDQVRRVTELITGISVASVEQTQGIGQVGDAINQLDQVTQQNAALVEESAAAADSLKQQAARLAQVVGVFKLEG
jgi:methyl-accepting chemotaxis protein